jgi:integrase
MATLRLALDKFKPNKKGEYPLRLVISSNQKTSYLSYNIFVKQESWDSVNTTILPSDSKFKRKNAILQSKFEAAEKIIDEYGLKGRLPSDPKKIRDLLSEKENVTFTDYLKEFIQTKTGKTKEVYQLTLNKIGSFDKNDLYFEDINSDWLKKFERKCQSDNNKVNTIGIHFRNIRTVFNCAIDNNLVSSDKYPFRKFKIKKEETAHRDLSLQDFKSILNFSGSIQQNWARDVFMLSFYLIGINMKDLYYLEDIDKGRIKYNRFKTNRLYNINVVPEAEEIINRLLGKKYLLNFADTIEHHENFIKKLNDYLKEIAAEINKTRKVKMPEFTTYAARHSWATFAGELDIPDKTIAKGLGHGQKTVTDIYNRFNDKKIDEANRKVIQYIFKRFRAVRKFTYKKITDRAFTS